MAIDDRANILIVDDLPDKLLALEAVLETLGQNIVTARSGREALRRLMELDFAVILLDVNMPDIDGFETAALIRQHKKSAHIPILFVTAYADEMHTLRGYSLGAVDYILSPVMPEVLRTKVGVFVDLYKKAKEIERHAEERIAFAREQAARLVAEEATRRSSFLAEASTVLAGSLDYDAIPDGLLRLVVPFLGDFSVITLLDDRGVALKTELAWADHSQESSVRTLSVEGGLDALPLSRLFQQVLKTGKSKFLPDINAHQPTVLADEALFLAEEHGAQCPSFRLRSAALIPLLARGRTLGAILLATGASDRRYSSADLALAEDLAGRAAIAIDNARLYRNIQERDRRKNEFLSMLAHELRNPLAPIRNAVEILKLHAPADARIEWARDVIDRQVQQIVRMVDDLLDVARITRGKIKLHVEPVNIAAVIASAVETSRPLIDARQHELTVTLPGAPMHVEGDRARLAQVLTNLLNNAAKYTENRGHIWVRADEKDNEVVIRVRDSGVGIPPEMLSTVFDPFTQADRSLDRSQGGLGIGLTLVRRLVEMHGGTVEAHSAGPKQGSEFVVRLPAIVPAGVRYEKPSSAAAEPVGNACARRILVVDDNVDSAESLGLILRYMGHEIRTAHDGSGALELAASFRPDIVLLDIGLPEMDGFEVARQLRAQSGVEKPLLIAVTGYGQAEDRRRSEDAGFDHHLVKPVDLQELQDLLGNSERLEAVSG